VKLSALVAKVQKGRGSFDYVLKISGLNKYKTIVVPFKSHARLNYWLAKPSAHIIDGCILGKNYVALWLSIPDLPAKREGQILAVDVGINKLMVDSDGTRYGTDMKLITARVRHCRPGSKGKLRARRTRDQYINEQVKKLPWSSIRIIGYERLKGLKTGKKNSRSKNFRKMIAPWTYRQALTRIEQLAQENRVLPVSYDPRNTSRQCPCCGSVAKENRRGESFKCVRCNYSNDADFVGALNGLVRTRGNCEQSMVAHSFCKS
jgi:transposase